MNKFAVLAFLTLSLSSPARAITINPNPSIPGYLYGGEAKATTAIKNVTVATQLKGFGISGPGQIQAQTTGALANSVIDLDRAPSISTYSGSDLINADKSYASAESFAELYYAFEIVGPSTTSVSVLIQASGKVQQQGFYSTAKASFSLGSSAGNFISDTIEANRDNSHIDSFSVDDHYILTSNTEYLVSMESSTNAGAGSILYYSGGSNATSSIDPYFSIDPGYSGYHFVFSDGINNSLVSAVPLPNSAPLFGAALLGLAGLGYGLNRRAQPTA